MDSEKEGISFRIDWDLKILKYWSMLKYKIMFQIFFVPKYFLMLEALIFGTLLPEYPVWL